jgi:hypothetical protein
MTALWSLVLLVLAAGCATAKGNALTLYQAQSQDLPVLLLLGAATLLAIYLPPALRLPSQLPRWWVMLLFGFAVAALLVGGAYTVFGDYPLARDEHMVLFDMAVYEHGRLATPLAPFWRPYAGALVPDFLLNSTMPSGLVSAYLPVNAMVRLAFSKLVDPALLNPLLAVAGGAALLDVARRIFGPQNRACWVVLLIYALSAQMLVNAMTPFSVTGHMALNLIWLAAFLRGGRIGHPIAILTGFLAVGLHQVVFHPFFVAPFLLWRLREGEWRLVLAYAVAYAVIVLWWVYYPLLPPVQTSFAGAVVAGETHRNFISERVMPLLLHRTPGTGGLMVLNMLRFFAWQNFTLLPLLVAAVPLAIRERGLPAALLLGILLWLTFVTLVLPYQGLGWGFRYLSPFLGSFALLAGYGYRDLSQRIGDRADGLVLALSAVTVVAAIPLLVVTTHRFAEPYLALEHLIAAQQTPFVVIDTAVSNPPDESWALHPLDQVRNLPDLSNRPLRFSGNRVNVRLLVALCDKGAVTSITRADMHRVGFMTNVPERSPRFDAMVAAVQQMRPGCLRQAAPVAAVGGA